METARSEAGDVATSVQLRLLGPLALIANGRAVELPASRKARALLAYLAMSPKPVSRGRLCELLWDGPNDPRGELRWCLSKIRRVLDEAGHGSVVTGSDTIALDLHDCCLDALDVSNAAEAGIGELGTEQLQHFCDLFGGDFAEGLELDRNPNFGRWLMAQRSRFRGCHVALLEHLIQRLTPGSDEVLRHVETWVDLAPFHERAHVSFLAELASRGEMSAGEEHLAAAANLFREEDVNFTPIRAAWHELKGRRSVPAAPVISSLIAPGNASFLDFGASTSRRASIAVMPFVERIDGQASPRGGLADGITHDIITRLAKLRSLFVIARGSVFALSERNIAPDEAGRRLNVDYVATGFLSAEANRVLVAVELVEVRTARIVWTETYDHRLDDTFLILDDIGNSIVSSISAEIEITERNRAMLKPPNSLDAWEAYHRGLWHMYRFTREENERAQHFFRMSLKQDPTFARAYAGLSFTHWQNAFQRWGDREEEGVQAFETAGQSLLADEHNPAAHWAMGRALWMRGRQDEALGALSQCVELSPNFALGHYALSFVHSQSGDPQVAIGMSDHSRLLSPFDPLLFGMMGARAMAHVRLGQFEEAAEWAIKAAQRPNAHVIIMAIAAHCLALAGRVSEAQAFSASIRGTHPGYRTDDFLATFRFAPDAERLFRSGSPLIGLG